MILWDASGTANVKLRVDGQDFRNTLSLRSAYFSVFLPEIFDDVVRGHFFSKDIEALKAELSDPRFSDKHWQEQINMMLDIGKKAEQQALASRGLDFVTEEYLPMRLSEMGII